MICSGCGSNITPSKNFVEFKCPSCIKETIIRCSKCKLTSNEYTCNKCKFVGP